jgi:RimJ/RimL family protein N-acetyltransferase
MIETARLILRRPEARDADAFVAYFATPRSAGNGGPLPAGRAWRSFATQLGAWQMLGHGMWAVTRRGEDHARGLIGPWCPADWPENEIGWMLFRAEDEGTGLAFEAARAALADAFGRLGWTTAVSYIAETNTRSRRLAERLGARPDPDAARPDTFEVPHLVYRHSPGAQG